MSRLSGFKDVAAEGIAIHRLNVYAPRWACATEETVVVNVEKSKSAGGKAPGLFFSVET
jgi:hypothetical protein